METLITQVLISFLIIVAIVIVLLFVVKKRKRHTHFQSKIINDTSYNIASIENHTTDDPETVEDYLDRKNTGDAQPFNRGDYELYNDKI